jgi:hypothetical protein
LRNILSVVETYLLRLLVWKGKHDRGSECDECSVFSRRLLFYAVNSHRHAESRTDAIKAALQKPLDLFFV